MSVYAANYMATAMPFTNNQKPRILKRFKFDLARVVDPAYWLYPHGLERTLLAFGHLVKTARRFYEYGQYNPLDILSDSPSCRGSWEVGPIRSLEDLRGRFHYALLHPHYQRTREWREAERIDIREQVCISGAHYTPMNFPDTLFEHEASANRSFDELLATTDKHINRPLNSCHKLGARWVHSVNLNFDREGKMSFVLVYGYRRNSSCWRHVLVYHRNDETPYQLLRRAIDELAELTSCADSVRVARPLFREGGGGSRPTSALQLRFDRIKLDPARQLVSLWHSTKPMFHSPRARACYSAEFDGLWYAAAIWSNPAARSLPQLTWLELRRFAIADDAPFNTASRMLAWMRRQIRARFPSVVKLISYQDRDQHTGVIYRADGWTPVEVDPSGGQWSHRAGSASRRVRNKVRWERRP